VNGLCPDACRVHEREGKRRIEGGREVGWPEAWTPLDLGQIAATAAVRK